MKCLPVALVLCLLAAPAAGADVYRWVDANGQVNYGDRPPPSARKLQQLDEAASRLSVVPGMSREEIDRLRERENRARLAELELEVAQLRARPPVTTVVVTEDEPRYIAYPVLRHPRHRLPHSLPPKSQLPVRGGPVRRTQPTP